MFCFWRYIIESRTFIKHSAALIKRIEDQRTAESLNITNSQDSRQAIQKDISSAFGGLQNPSLMAAQKLKKAALENEYTVSPPVLQRLAAGEACWS